MIELTAFNFFCATLALLALAGFAMTFIVVTKGNDERISKLEQESAMRAAAYGRMAVKGEILPVKLPRLRAPIVLPAMPDDAITLVPSLPKQIKEPYA